MRRLGIAALAAILLAAGGESARAADLGAPAPPLEAAEWVGTPIDWKKERGKVVVLLFVKARDADSALALQDQIEAQKKWNKHGLDHALVAEGPKGEVDIWARTVLRGAQFRIAIEKDGRISVVYLAQTVPFAAVVDRDGKLRFTGHPTRERVMLAKAIEEALDRAPTIPRGSTSARFKAAWEAIDKRDWKPAIAALREIRDDPAAAPDDVDDAKGLLWMVGVEGRKAITAALRFANVEEWAECLAALEEFATIFEGHEVAEDMRKLAGDMRKDAALKKEIEAGDEERAARKLEREGKRDEAVSKYQKVASTAKWKGTKAAARAKKRADELKKGAKLISP